MPAGQSGPQERLARLLLHPVRNAVQNMDGGKAVVEQPRFGRFCVVLRAHYVDFFHTSMRKIPSGHRTGQALRGRAIAKDKPMPELKEKLRNIVAEVSEIDEIPDKTPFQDLGIDSMMAIEIVAEVEREYQIQVPEEQLQQLTSFEKVYSAVSGHLAVA